jgi:hypothetical protein
MVMRCSVCSIGSLTRAALGLGLTAAFMAVSLPARAGDDDVPIDTRILRSIMHSLGLKRGDEATINYQERPPLVIPPEDNLPPPQKANAETNNPAWPKDPDVLRAKQARKKVLTSAGSSSEAFETASKPLMPDQLAPNAGRVPHRQVQPGVTDVSVRSDGDPKLTPSQLGAGKTSLWDRMFHTDDDQTAKFTGEPPRVSLTEPPPGYMTPSPDQPYGKSTAATPKATDYYVEHVTPSMDK